MPSKGSCYEKPFGTCIYNQSDGYVYGCSCSAPAGVIYALTKDYEIDVVACTDDCDGDSCPNAPKGTGSCDPVGYVETACLINCKDDKDCLETAICYDGGGPSGVCMYRP
ncbi:hypothetical protein FOL47_008088 [Perkinsus chesapeaki]|uniref:Uncharacterized protein n=1 Tax=Perkinsus chesapeaki TaxID=330153 RepID=A0A7J6MUH2_PERCH|nr:hypothetical protein FOL47_008088 [Perkinsus chesapeaki]